MTTFEQQKPTILPLLPRRRHADAVAACPLLRDQRTFREEAGLAREKDQFPLSASTSLKRMILPEPVRGISETIWVASGIL